MSNFPFLWGQKLEEMFPGLKLREFGPTLKKLRAYRTPEEIKLVKKSAALVDGAFTQGVNAIKPGKTEWEVMARMDFLLKSNGVESSVGAQDQEQRDGVHRAYG